jgi:hypothetical protein
MNQPEYRTNMARAGYNMVKQYYGWEEKLRNYVFEK